MQEDFRLSEPQRTEVGRVERQSEALRGPIRVIENPQ